MSHKAMNWALQVRGLKPATKVVLLHLADRHNKDTDRCDPSQARLAEECEMSRSTVNLHLNQLEKYGFIEREQGLDPKTRKQLRTKYRLNQHVLRPVIEDQPRVRNSDTEPVSEKQPIPCPKNGQSRVRNSDTNPVREPGREPRAHARPTPSGQIWILPDGSETKPVPSRFPRIAERAEALVQSLRKMIEGCSSQSALVRDHCENTLAKISDGSTGWLTEHAEELEHVMATGALELAELARLGIRQKGAEHGG